MKGRAYKTKVIAPAERHRHGEPSPQERNVAARARAVARVARLRGHALPGEIDDEPCAPSSRRKKGGRP